LDVFVPASAEVSRALTKAEAECQAIAISWETDPVVGADEST
jgi:hypothetical protein